MTLRAVVAMMEHETNTFSPVPTPLSRFGFPEVPTGREVRKHFEGTGTGLGAFLEVADEEGMETITPVAGHASPSGPVHADAYAFMCDAICEAVSGGCDLCFLDLHGAMVTETTDDGEGTLLSRIRSIAPDLPIAISLDLHANLTPEIIENCDILVGYKTYPHVDMYEAGRHAGDLMVRKLRGEITPVMRWGQRPILAQTLRMGHDDMPMKRMIELARDAEANGLLAASVFGGFPLADIHNAGLSVVTISDGREDQAAATAERLLAEAWQMKSQWLFDSEPLETTISQAAAMEDGPVILLDHADNAASGGTQDTVAVLREVIKQGLKDVAMFAICDPDAVETMTQAGVGQTITLDLGGKVDMPEIGRTGEPLTVTGKVRCLTDGDFVVTAAMARGTTQSMGPSAVFETGNVQVVVVSRNTEPFDVGCFRSVGIEPTTKLYLILKSRIHYRAGFSGLSIVDLPCNGVGVTSSDNSLFRFRKVRRPIYPLEPACPELPNYDASA